MSSARTSLFANANKRDDPRFQALGNPKPVEWNARNPNQNLSYPASPQQLVAKVQPQFLFSRGALQLIYRGDAYCTRNEETDGMGDNI